jgi:hypothetical protein
LISYRADTPDTRSAAERPTKSIAGIASDGVVVERVDERALLVDNNAK